MAEIKIDRSLDQVWSVFTDVKTWKSWWGGDLRTVRPCWQRGAMLTWANGGDASLYDFVEKDFDSKFHITRELAGVPNLHYTFRFHTDDPRKLHPTWKEPIWKLIEGSEIAIGMTEEMAKMACGRDIRPAGFVLTGEETSPIYLCHYKKFLVEKGKVTKYVE